jgi:hypothetical protein
VYTDAEVNQVIRASERRPGRGRGPTGHVGERHVLITNVELANRADGFDTDTPLACAFVGTPEAVQAVTEALNSAEGQAALQHLDQNYPTGIRVRLEARVTPLTVRYSSGMEIVRKVAVPSVLVLLERIEDPNYFGLHIHTAFPILFFRRGAPAWLDSRNVWH